MWEVYDIVKDKQFLKLQLELLSEAGRDPNIKNRMMLALERSREFIQMGAESVVNEGGDDPIALPPHLSFMIGSFLLGLRITEFVANDQKLGNEAYQMFIAMLTGAMNRERRQQPPAAEAG